MAIAYDAVGAGGSVAPGTSLSYSHTATAGSTVILWLLWSDSAANTITVTFGGSTMTQIGSNLDFQTFGSTWHLGAWKLASAPGGASTVSVSLSVSAYANANSVSYTGVSSIGSLQTNSGSANTMTLTATSASGHVLTQMFGGGYAASAGFSSYNQTSRYNAYSGLAWTEPILIGEAAGSSSVSFSASSGTAGVFWGAGAVDLTGAAGGTAAGALTGNGALTATVGSNHQTANPHGTGRLTGTAVATKFSFAAGFTGQGSLFVPGTSPMVWDATATGTTSFGSTATWTHTIGSSATIIFILFEYYGSGSPSATVGGVSATEIYTAVSYGGTGSSLSLFALANPPTGAQTVTASAFVNGINAVSVSYIGVGSAGTPIVTGATTSGTASVTVPGAGKEVGAIGALGSGSPGTGGGSTLTSPNQTARYAATQMLFEEYVGSSSVTFTGVSSAGWVAIGVPLLPTPIRVAAALTGRVKLSAKLGKLPQLAAYVTLTAGIGFPYNARGTGRLTATARATKFTFTLPLHGTGTLRAPGVFGFVGFISNITGHGALTATAAVHQFSIPRTIQGAGVLTASVLARPFVPVALRGTGTVTPNARLFQIRTTAALTGHGVFTGFVLNPFNQVMTKFRTGQNVVIMESGDSTSVGYGDQLIYFSWPGRLVTWLAQHYHYNVIQKSYQGTGLGWKTTALLQFGPVGGPTVTWIADAASGTGLPNHAWTAPFDFAGSGTTPPIDCYIIALGINDWLFVPNGAAFAAEYQSFVTTVWQYMPGMPILVTTENPTVQGSGFPSAMTQQFIGQPMLINPPLQPSLAEPGLSVLDTYQAAPLERSNSPDPLGLWNAGLMYDGLHPSDAGQQATAMFFLEQVDPKVNWVAEPIPAWAPPVAGTAYTFNYSYWVVQDAATGDPVVYITGRGRLSALVSPDTHGHITIATGALGNGVLRATVRQKFAVTSALSSHSVLSAAAVDPQHQPAAISGHGRLSAGLANVRAAALGGFGLLAAAAQRGSLYPQLTGTGLLVATGRRKVTVGTVPLTGTGLLVGRGGRGVHAALPGHGALSAAARMYQIRTTAALTGRNVLRGTSVHINPRAFPHGHGQLSAVATPHGATRLVFFPVTGTFVAVSDPFVGASGNTPELEPIQALITFTPRLAAGEALYVSQLVIESGGGQTHANTALIVPPLTARIFDGVLSTIDIVDTPGFQLVSGAAALNLPGGTLIYDVTFDKVTFNSAPQVLAPFSFTAPVDGTPVILTTTATPMGLRAEISAGDGPPVVHELAQRWNQPTVRR